MRGREWQAGLGTSSIDVSTFKWSWTLSNLCISLCEPRWTQVWFPQMAWLFPAPALGILSWMVTFPVLFNLFSFTQTLYWKLKPGFLQGSAFPLCVTYPAFVNHQAEGQADISATMLPCPPLSPQPSDYTSHSPKYRWPPLSSSLKLSFPYMVFFYKAIFV